MITLRIYFVALTITFLTSQILKAENQIFIHPNKIYNNVLLSAQLEFSLFGSAFSRQSNHIFNYGFTQKKWISFGIGIRNTQIKVGTGVLNNDSDSRVYRRGSSKSIGIKYFSKGHYDLLNAHNNYEVEFSYFGYKSSGYSSIPEYYFNYYQGIELNLRKKLNMGFSIGPGIVFSGKPYFRSFNYFINFKCGFSFMRILKDSCNQENKFRNIISANFYGWAGVYSLNYQRYLKEYSNQNWSFTAGATLYRAHNYKPYLIYRFGGAYSRQVWKFVYAEADMGLIGGFTIKGYYLSPNLQTSLNLKLGDQLFKFGMSSNPRYEYEIMDYESPKNYYRPFVSWGRLF